MTDFEKHQAYYESIIKLGGGMITCGDHLGVMVGTDEKACPLGWVFLPIQRATVELIGECVEYATKGRKAWPPKYE